MLTENEQLFDFLNITEWHNHGYTGTRGLTATQELWDVSNYNPDGMVITSDEDQFEANSAHPINMAKCFFEIAPGRKLLQLPKEFKRYIRERMNPSVFATIDAIIRYYKVDIMFSGNVHEYNGKLSDLYFSSLRKHFICFMNSTDDTGNVNNGMVHSDYVYGAGSYIYKNNKVTGIMTSDEMIHNSLAFVPTNLYIPYSNKIYDKDSVAREFYGASSAAAILAGMMSLVNDYFIDKIERPLSRTEAKRFIMKNSIEISHKVYAFILPKIDELKVTDYVSHIDRTDIHDIDDITDETLKKSILEIVNDGLLLLDKNHNFNASEPITRGEFAQSLYNLIKYLED